MPESITGFGGGGNGVAFLVSSGIVTGIIAAQCSSPQTAEINIGKRADTLMKWVHVGCVQAILFVAIAAIIEPEHKESIIAGGGLMIAIMYGSYMHAKKSRLQSSGAGTET